MEDHEGTYGGGFVEFCVVCGWSEAHIADEGGCFDRTHQHFPCAGVSDG